MTESIVAEKICTKCRIQKPLSDFYKCRKGKNGLNPQCGKCVAARSSAYRLRPEVQEMKKRWYKAHLEKHGEKRRKDGREYRASPKGLAVARQWYWRDPDKHREKNREYRNSEKGQAARKAYNKRIYADPARRRIMRDKRFQSKFGITVEQYDKEYRKQKGRCAICWRPYQKYRLHVDHDHQTGAFRGLLCFPCNVVLGAWGDSPEAGDRAAAYLRRHAQLRLVV